MSVPNYKERPRCACPRRARAAIRRLSGGVANAAPATSEGYAIEPGRAHSRYPHLGAGLSGFDAATAPEKDAP